jgi:hypothetical protein
LQGIIAGHYCRALLQGIIAICRALLQFAGHYCRALLKVIIAGQGRYSRMIDCRDGGYCGALLLGIIEVPGVIAGRYYGVILQGVIT